MEGHPQPQNSRNKASSLQLFYLFSYQAIMFLNPKLVFTNQLYFAPAALLCAIWPNKTLVMCSKYPTVHCQNYLKPYNLSIHVTGIMACLHFYVTYSVFWMFFMNFGRLGLWNYGWLTEYCKFICVFLVIGCSHSNWRRWGWGYWWGVWILRIHGYQGYGIATGYHPANNNRASRFT